MMEKRKSEINVKALSEFSSILESEVLNDVQMNALEAGSRCESGCKQACHPGNQNKNTGNGNGSANDITISTGEGAENGKN